MLFFWTEKSHGFIILNIKQPTVINIENKKKKSFLSTKLAY